MLSNQEVAEELLGKFGEQVYDFEEPYGMLTLSTTREEIISVLEFLNTHKSYQINFLTDLTGVHYPDNEGKEFMVVYHLHSFIHNFRIRLKVFIPEADIHIPTATGIFACATGWKGKLMTFLEFF